MTQWSPMAATLVRSAKNRSWREQPACWLLAESGVGERHWPDRLEEAGLIAWETQEDEDWDLAFVHWTLLPEDPRPHWSIIPRGRSPTCSWRTRNGR